MVSIGCTLHEAGEDYLSALLMYFWKESQFHPGFPNFSRAACRYECVSRKQGNWKLDVQFISSREGLVYAIRFMVELPPRLLALWRSLGEPYNELSCIQGKRHTGSRPTDRYYVLSLGARFGTANRTPGYEPAMSMPLGLLLSSLVRNGRRYKQRLCTH